MGTLLRTHHDALPMICSSKIHINPPGLNGEDVGGGLARNFFSPSLIETHTPANIVIISTPSRYDTSDGGEEPSDERVMPDEGQDDDTGTGDGTAEARPGDDGRAALRD